MDASWPVGFDEGGEVGFGFRVFGIAGEISLFVGIVCVVVELRAFGAVVPEDVTPAFGADAVARKAGALDLGEGRPVPFCFWIVEEGTEADAFEMGWGSDAGEVGERGIKVEEFDGAGGGGAAVFLIGRGNDEGHAGGFFKVALFHPEAVFAEVKAVIAPENDNGVVPEFEAIEGVEDTADLGVDEGNGGEVGAFAFAGLIDGESTVGPWPAGGERGRGKLFGGVGVKGRQ